jgi:ribonuclease HI
VYRKHKVRFHWVRGHNGHPQNELCDQLAVAASKQAILQVDEAYENGDAGMFDE